MARTKLNEASHAVLSWEAFMVGSNLRGNSCGRQSSSLGAEGSRRKQGGLRRMRVGRMEIDGAMETWGQRDDTGDDDEGDGFSGTEERSLCFGRDGIFPSAA